MSVQLTVKRHDVHSAFKLYNHMIATGTGTPSDIIIHDLEEDDIVPVLREIKNNLPSNFFKIYVQEVQSMSLNSKFKIVVTKVSVKSYNQPTESVTFGFIY